MHILGISCFYHDAAAAILRDGRLIAASEEERFSRKKHDFGFPELAIEFFPDLSLFGIFYRVPGCCDDEAGAEFHQLSCGHLIKIR